MEPIAKQIKTGTKVLGLCGCEGAGKTTIAKMLVGNSNPNSTPKKESWKIPNPKLDVVEKILGMSFNGNIYMFQKTRDPVWNITGEECAKRIKQLMRKYVDSRWNWQWCANIITWTLEKPAFKTNWVEIALADKLKYVAALLFNFDYNVLLAKTPETRKLREEKTTQEYNICGKLTGRQILEYFGTDIMRKEFDDEVWIKIMKRDVNYYRELEKNIVIQDIRFENEKNALKELGGELVVVYRDPEDLEITENDRRSHPAKWHFKKFINSPDIPVTMLHNNSSLAFLQWRIQSLGF